MTPLFGKYAAYIIPAYTISLVSILAAVVIVVQAWRTAKARLAALEADKS